MDLRNKNWGGGILGDLDMQMDLTESGISNWGGFPELASSWESGAFNMWFNVNRFNIVTVNTDSTGADVGHGQYLHMNSINYWNDLFDLEWPDSNIVTSDNVSFKVIIVKLSNYDQGLYSGGSIHNEWVFVLKNTSPIGQVRDMQWVFSYNSSGSASWDNIVSTPRFEVDSGMGSALGGSFWPYTDSLIEIFNFTNHILSWVGPHDIHHENFSAVNTYEQMSSGYFSLQTEQDAFNTSGDIFNQLNIPGDFNNDDIVDILDMVTMVNHIMNNEDYLSEYDLNDDNIIDILDVISLINIILAGNEQANGG